VLFLSKNALIVENVCAIGHIDLIPAQTEFPDGICYNLRHIFFKTSILKPLPFGELRA